MKGLLKNNLYAVLSNMKLFSVLAVLLGIFVVAMDNELPSLIIGYMLSVMVGFSFIAVSGIQKGSASKWNKYKLTAPVKRSDVIKSYFASQLLWLFAGMIFAGAAVSLSIALHGFPFDRDTDIFMLFVTGISVSLFMDAFFFPLSALTSSEKAEAILIISLLFSVLVTMGLVTLLNTLFPNTLTPTQIILGGTAILLSASLLFALSCPLTVCVFRRKEF